MSAKQCDRCSQPFKGFGTTCSKCRKGGKNGGAPHDCDRCGTFFVGHGTVCDDCLQGRGLGRTGVRIPSPDEVDAVLDKIGICIMKVDTSQTSMVKLRQAEINLLGQLETIRDLMERIYKSGDRLALRSTFIDCGRMARLIAFLSQCRFSEMNAKDQRFFACQKTCEALRTKVADELEIGDQLAEATDEADRHLLRARLSIVMDAEKVNALQQVVLAAPVLVSELGDTAAFEVDDTDPYEDDFESESDEEPMTEDQEDERFTAQVRVLFDELDKDGDGCLSREEVKNAAFGERDRVLFDELDRNGDGNLSREEVKNAAFGLSDMLKACRIHKRSHVIKMFKQGDLDGNGTLDFDEFLAYIMSARQRAIEATPKKIDDNMVRMVFQTMDKDGDGSITYEELKFCYAGILLRAGEPVEPKRVNKWARRNFKKYDTDNSKSLDYQEFHAMLQNCGGLRPMLQTVGRA